jgi:hypothetical protein
MDTILIESVNGQGVELTTHLQVLKSSVLLAVRCLDIGQFYRVDTGTRRIIPIKM